METWKDMVRDTLTVWEKDTRVWLKKPLVVISRALIFPLVYLVIFANAMGGPLTNLPVAVVDLNGGIHAQQFLSAMETGNTIKIAAVPTYEKALEMFQARQVYAIIVIPAGLEQVNLIIDQSSPTISSTIEGVVSAAAVRYSAKSGFPTLPVKIDVHYARGASYLEFLTPGVIIQTIAMGSLFSGGMTLLFEKELGVLNQLLVAPVSKIAIIMGKILSAVTQSMTSGITSLAIAFLLGAKIKTGITGIFFLLILMFLVSFCFIGLGIAMTAYIHDQQAWMMIMQMIVMPLWIVSGTFFPIESLPTWLHPLATISPLTYATEAARNIMIRGFVFSSVSGDLMILSLISLATLAFGITSFRRTVE